MHARVFLIGLLLGMAVLSGCGGDPTPTRHIALPPADASPETVVRTYLRALDTHDRATVRALSTPDHAETVGEAWFANTVSITDVHLLPSFTEPDTDPKGQPRIDVPVRFDLRQRHAQTMDDGPTSWTYILVRQGDRWLITDEGNG